MTDECLRKYSSHFSAQSRHDDLKAPVWASVGRLHGAASLLQNPPAYRDREHASVKAIAPIFRPTEEKLPEMYLFCPAGSGERVQLEQHVFQ